MTDSRDDQPLDDFSPEDHTGPRDQVDFEHLKPADGHPLSIEQEKEDAFLDVEKLKNIPG